MISDILPRYQEVANGSKKAFTVPFDVIDSSFINVYLDKTKQTSGYSISGKVITFNTAPANNKIVTIVRVVPIDWEQEVLGAVNKDTLNNVFTRLVAKMQTLEEEISRAIKADVTDTETDIGSEQFLSLLSDAIDKLNQANTKLTQVQSTANQALTDIGNARNTALTDINARVDEAEENAELAKQWAIGEPSEPEGGSAKHWAEEASSTVNELETRVATIEGNYVTTNTAQTVSNRKTFLGEKAIYFKQNDTTNKLGFTLYNSSDTELGAFEWRPSTIGGGALLNINVPYASSNWVGFRYWGTAVNIIAPKVATAGDYYIPVNITDGTNTVTATSNGTVDISSLLPNSAVWGNITGTLSNQTDLQNALNAKANDSDVVKTTGDQTIYGNKTFVAAFYIASDSGHRSTYARDKIEFYPLSTTTNGGFIDFHYAGSGADYTSRIIENSSGNLNIDCTSVTAPTPATSDNSNKIATSAFVKNQGYWRSMTYAASTKTLTWS